MMGLVRADRGDVAILGRKMPAEERWIKARVGFVSEDMALYGAKTLRWHMDLVASLHEGWDERRARGLLDRLDLNPDQRAKGMSRGQQVKAMLLLALSRHASVLILDEPTAGLDPIVRHELLGILAASRDERQAIVFSSHHGEDVSALADDVVFLHAGRIVANAPVTSFLKGGGSLESAFLRCVCRLTGGRAA
jgi:ABC-2 type transport system ATP-binding protein